MYQNRWRLFFGVLFIVLGGVWLWNNLDIGPRLDLGALWPLLLVALGVYMILRQTAWASRAGATGTDMVDRIIGDVRLGGPGWNVKNNSVFTIIGDVDVDLRGASIPDGESTIHLRALIGDIDVFVPPDVALFAGASSVIGDLRILGQRRDGFFQDLTLSTPGYATAERKVRIEADMIIGDIEVRQV